MDEMDQDLAADNSVGQRLRRAREAQGLTLDDVAMKTRIPIRHLRSIEDSSWGDLPAVTYTVGFARNYANAIGMDGVEIGRELREQLGGGQVTNQMSPEYYNAPDPARVPSRSLAIIAGLLAIVLVVGYLWWRSTLDDDAGQTAQPQQNEQVAQQPAQQPAQPAQPQSVAGQPVTLVAVGDVWMNITDRTSGRRIYYATLRTGDRFQVPADAAQPVLQTTNPQLVRVMIGNQDRGLLAPERRRLTNQSLRAEDLAAAPAPGAQPAGPAPASGNGFRPML